MADVNWTPGEMIAPKDKMQDWLNSQSELQRKMPSPHPTDLFTRATEEDRGDYELPTDEDRKPAIDFLHWNVTALTDELHELLGEIGWKPWAKSRHINLEAARGEAIDAMHFLANIFLVLGLDDAEEVMRRYHAKHKKNAARQEAGYDGVSTKCPGCKRALDDDAVECLELTGLDHDEQARKFPRFEGQRFFRCTVSGGLYRNTPNSDGIVRRLKEKSIDR